METFIRGQRFMSLDLSSSIDGYMIIKLWIEAIGWAPLVPHLWDLGSVIRLIRFIVKVSGTLLTWHNKLSLLFWIENGTFLWSCSRWGIERWNAPQSQIFFCIHSVLAMKFVLKKIWENLISHSSRDV